MLLPGAGLGQDWSQIGPEPLFISFRHGEEVVCQFEIHQLVPGLTEIDRPLDRCLLKHAPDATKRGNVTRTQEAPPEESSCEDVRLSDTHDRRAQVAVFVGRPYYGGPGDRQ